LQSTLTMIKASDIVLILIAIIFLPAVILVVTGCSCDLLVNILLTLIISTFLSCWFLLISEAVTIRLFTRTYSCFLVDLQEDAGRREVWRIHWQCFLIVLFYRFSTSITLASTHRFSYLWITKDTRADWPWVILITLHYPTGLLYFFLAHILCIHE